MLVFVYLNPDTGAVQVSVDWETAEIVRADGSLPLRVDAQDTVLLDDTLPAPAGRRQEATS